MMNTDSMAGETGRKADFAADWRWLLAGCAAVYLACLGIRLLEYPVWTHPGLWVGGDPILATHDSYFWLAVAKGVREASHSYLGWFVGAFASVTGMSLAQAAFWLPTLMGSLVSVACFVWGWFLGGRWAGIAAGLVGGLAPGFFSRTRMGYLDTDMFTLLMPLMTGFLLALLLRPLLRAGWLPGNGEQGETAPTGLAFRSVLLALAFGLAVRLGGIWHADLVYIHLLLWYLAIGLVLVAGRPGLRGPALVLLGVFGASAFINAGELVVPWYMLDFRLVLPGFLGGENYYTFYAVVMTGLAAGYGWLASRPSGRATVLRSLAAGLVLCALLGVLANLFAPLQGVLAKLWFYLTPAAVSSGAAQAAGPAYPSIVQSIIETKLVGPGTVLERIGPTTWLSVAGIAGFLWVCWKRPLAVFLLPLLLLALAGMKMGIRFTMFGGPMVALGLGVSLAWLTDRIPGRWTGRPWALPVVQVAAGVLLLIPLVARYSALNPTPVVDKPHAEALIKLGGIAPEGSMVWTWWDWGYATQYYSGRMTPVDGGLHAGRDVYPTALVLATSSLEQANRAIRWSALQGHDPAGVWDGMSGAEAAAFVDSLKSRDVQTPDIGPQYLVVTWANFPIIKWINFFGDWDLAKGEGAGAENQRIRNFQFDPGRGAVVFENGSSVPVSSVDSLEPELTNHKDYWGNAGGPHLVFNRYRGDAFLMNDTAYRSAMVQLLLARPSEVRDQFELVYDGSPHVRVYKVVGSGS